MNEAQVPIVLAYRRWLEARIAGLPRKLILFGGGKRGGGKTYIFTALLLATGIALPGSICFMVSPTLDKRDEIERTIKKRLPATWRLYQKRELQFVLPTGSVAKNISGEVPESVKRGDAEIVFLNEAQDMQVGVYSMGLGALRTGGLMFIAANPPQRQRGEWVLEVKDRIQDGTIAGEYVDVDPALNDNVDHATMTQIAVAIRAVDKRAADADSEGLWRPVGDRAYPRWSRHLIGVPPDIGLEDVTAALTGDLFWVAYPFVAGGDFQGRPHQAVAIFKVYFDPATPPPHLVYWVVDELIVEGTELHLSDAAYEHRYTPDTLLWIPDASGAWQDGPHSKGRTSYELLRDQLWIVEPPTSIKRPDRSVHAKNPDVEARLGLMYLLMEQRRFRVHPRCVWTSESAEKCPLGNNRYGRRRPYGQHAHIMDACGYPIWRLEPKPGEGGNVTPSDVSIVSVGHRSPSW